MLRRAALAAMFLLALSTVSVAANSPVVTISGNHFSPTPFSATLGGLVHWSNTDNANHTSTADQFGLWNIPATAHTESGDA